MFVEKFKIEIAGRSARLYVSNAGERSVAHDEPVNSFSSRVDAEKKASVWGLKDFVVVPYQRDIGTPTKLAEIGL